MHYLWYAIAVLFVVGVTIAVLNNHRSVATGVIEHDGLLRLGECPGSPNCVSSYQGSGYAELGPWRYDSVDRDTARIELVSMLLEQPRVRILERRDDYVHALFVSRLFRFRDDVEFYLPPDEPLIHFRAESRLGKGDLGVHEKRMRELHRHYSRRLPRSS